MLQDRVPGSRKGLGWTQLLRGQQSLGDTSMPARISPSIDGHTEDENGQSTSQHQGWDSHSPRGLGCCSLRAYDEPQ